jgi:hypothetical protein
MGEAAELSNQGKVVDVALAEYNQLRAEVVGCQNREGALVGIGLTAIGVVMTIALKGAGNHRLLLGVPPFALVMTLLQLGQARTITRIGDYIRLQLWPRLQKETGYPESWEQYQFNKIAGLTRGTVWDRICAAVRDLGLESGPEILFFGMGPTALLFARPPQLWWWIGDGACLLLLAVAGIAFAWMLQRRDA